MKQSNEYRPFISVVIPVEKETDYLKEALSFYGKQTYTHFEVLIASTYPIKTDYPFAKVIVGRRLKNQVSLKRNTIIKHGKGEIFVFTDDDVFVPPTYLANVAHIFKNSSVVAACGPLLTPSNDSLMQKASGLVWESFMGSVGAGIYRSRKMKRRMVYDYPAANLIVRRSVFTAIGGYEKNIYPGEDTKLLIDMYQETGKGAMYDPRLTAYHHRKPLFKKHLAQIGRYGFQRGQFSLAYPTTSFKLSYFLPALLVVYEVIVLLYVVIASPVYNLTIMKLVLAPIGVYGVLLFIETWYIVYRNGLVLGILAALGIVTTHGYYGYNFIVGFSIRILNRIKRVISK